ncbi:MAG: hypothetical protein EOP04_14400, partial [Proteobacteria bacterium]
MQKFTSITLLINLLGVLGACEKYEARPSSYDKKVVNPAKNTGNLETEEPGDKPDDDDPVVPETEKEDIPNTTPNKEEPEILDPKIPEEPSKPAFS